MEHIFNSPHLWLIFIFSTFANAVYFYVRAREDTKNHPELSVGCRTLIQGWLFWGSLPWLVMAAGLETGHVWSVWYYLRPHDGNPYVLAWYGCVVVLWILGLCWVFLRGGAELIAKHHRIFRGDQSSPAKVKLICLLSVAAGAVALIVLVFVDVRLPVWSR